MFNSDLAMSHIHIQIVNSNARLWAESLPQVNGTGAMRCTSAFAGVLPSNETYVILGGPFLRAYYTAFRINDINDLTKSSVGFAASASANGVTAFLGM